MRIKSIGLTLLFITGATNAFSDPGAIGRSPKDAVRAYHVQNVLLDRDNGRQQQPGPQLQDQRRPREAGVPESSGFGGQREGNSNSSAENGRKQGRLSPDERRALRRQIDEAGHDIYAPKR